MANIRFGAPKSIRNGLIFHLDSYNPKSYINGSTWTDLSNFNNCTLTNTTFNNSSINFNGTTSKGSLGNNLLTELGVTSGTQNDVAYSMECVFKINTQPIGVGLDGYSLMGHASVGGIGLHAFNDGVNFGYRSNSNIDFTGVALSTNVWYHAVGTRAVGGDVFTYLNGVQEASNTTSGSTYLSVNYVIADFEIGDADSRIGKLNGDIVVCKVYNRVLTPSEVEYNYNIYKSRLNLSI